MTLFADWNASVNVPFQRIRAMHGDSGGGLQEGVVGATDLKVAQRGAGANMSVDVPAGAAWVQIDTGTRNGLGHVYNDATANVVVSASSGTNPRIDQIILRWNDTSIPTGSGNVPTLEVLTGTATGGATLDNRTGAAALPNDCLRLADILVPTSSTSVVTANIRDRRPWARGAYFRINRNANAAAGSDYTTTSLTFALIDGTNLQPRIECSGAPLRVSLRGVAANGGDKSLIFQPWIDGAVAEFAGFRGSGNLTTADVGPLSISWDIFPAAGSHLIGWAWALGVATTGTLRANATQTAQMVVEELVRSSASNT